MKTKTVQPAIRELTATELQLISGGSESSSSTSSSSNSAAADKFFKCMDPKSSTAQIMKCLKS